MGANRNVGRPVSSKPAPLRNSHPPKSVSKGRGTLWFHPNLDSSLWLHEIPGYSWRSQVWGQVSAVVQATSLVCTAVELAKSRKDVSPSAEGCICFSPRDRARLETRRPRQRPVVRTQLFVYPSRCNIRMKKVPPTHTKKDPVTLFSFAMLWRWCFSESVVYISWRSWWVIMLVSLRTRIFSVGGRRYRRKIKEAKKTYCTLNEYWEDQCKFLTFSYL